VREQRATAPTSQARTIQARATSAGTADPSRVRARLETELACLDEVTLPRLVQTLAVTEGGTAQGRARRAAIEADVRRVRARADAIRRSLAAERATPGRAIPAQARATMVQA
jgi:hypothetical protein